MPWYNIIEQDKLLDGQHHVCVIQDKAIAVFNLNNEFYAIEDYCPHQGLPLSEGLVENGEIECPFHGARFCLKSGQVLSPPACQSLTTYDVVTELGMIRIKI